MTKMCAHKKASSSELPLSFSHLSANRRNELYDVNDTTPRKSRDELEEAFLVHVVHVVVERRKYTPRRRRRRRLSSTRTTTTTPTRRRRRLCKGNRTERVHASRGVRTYKLKGEAVPDSRRARARVRIRTHRYRVDIQERN